MIRVRTRCEHVTALVQRYARDVENDGLFVRTPERFVPGAPVRFEYLLSDGSCALAGEGRVAFVRGESEVAAAAVGIGIAIDRLRHGDRAVVERMCAARAGLPSRFERPDAPGPVSSRPPLRADALFGDVKIGRGEAPAAVEALLSADLTSDLPTVRPPSSGRPSGPASVPVRGGAALRGHELADELEPPVEVLRGAPDLDATPLFVPLERASLPPAPRAAASEGSDRPSRPSSSSRLRSEPQKAVDRSEDLERDQRFAQLLASASRDSPPSARSSGLLIALLSLLVAALSLAALSGAFDPWLGR